MKKRVELWHFKIIIFVIGILILGVYFVVDPDISVQTLLEHTPQNSIRAAVVLLLLYVFKSATIFFPLIILEIATGHFFSTWIALGINFVGIQIVLIVPYWIGRAVGLEAIQKLVQKYPKFGKVLDKQQTSSFFLCFFLRIISCLPGDMVTMYLGATRTPFWQNLLAGTLGLLPCMILATFMGEGIRNPQSPLFWVSVVLMGILAMLSILFYYLYQRRLKKGGK